MRLDYAPRRPSATLNVTSRGLRAGDRYLLALGLVLAGYAIFSRSVAYLGAPPLFIGEILLALGLAVVARSGRLGPLFAQPAAWVITALLGLAVVRTLPFLGTYGLDAPRDAMQVGYGLYALIVGGLLVARPERLPMLLRAYGRFIPIALALFWLVYLAFKTAEASIPALPWAAHVKVIEAKGGDMMVHLCGIATFLVMGLGRRTPLMMGALALNTGLIVVSNRGGMLAFVLGCAVAWMMRPPEARVGRLVYAFAALLLVGVAVGPVVRVNGGDRSVSVEQLWTNVKSVFGQGGDAHLDNTKQWRLDWWGKIYDYTVRGPYFWTGKGFGVNLARDDGFDVVPELRSPHNGHMTILARMGVPGAALWVLLQVVWGVALLRAWARARRAGHHRWMATFAFLVAYWLAALINGAFDVYFEGPVGAIWFWTVVGVGLAATWLHAQAPDTLRDDLDPLDDAQLPARAAVPAWGWYAAPDAPAASWRRAPARAARAQSLPAGGGRRPGL